MDYDPNCWMSNEKDEAEEKKQESKCLETFGDAKNGEGTKKDKQEFNYSVNNNNDLLFDPVSGTKTERETAGGKSRHRQGGK